ncbi:hypothetical protein DAPPUDRAFT_305293 [Daphnia pulex]|uniref:Uncharacterized protein n=1 Tax=Daphnia pulex TaxID=6669 RepID=E9I3Q3_DAPPU|nr:hypothetical protein DAPPUDRAFT_305293 [Daphnia pulex]|eukprot:EFX61375.1 hypothetical protein DAPPUDRAFT_305293 [Daphnia pulex]
MMMIVVLWFHSHHQILYSLRKLNFIMIKKTMKYHPSVKEGQKLLMSTLLLQVKRATNWLLFCRWILRR